MTSQIVEEQIKLMENKLIEAGVAVRGNGVSLDKVTFIGTNLYVSEFFRSFAYTLIEREREFTKEEQEIIKQDMEGLLRIAQMTRTVKISGEPTPGMIAWMKEDQRQDKIREQIIKKINSRTKLQEMR